MAFRCGPVVYALCLIGLLFGCDPEEPNGEGAGGEGGGVGVLDAGAGGMGGAGGAGAMGGAGGDPDGPCDQLGEERCVARADCVARFDVFDEFAMCRDADDAACRLLDEAQCGARDDCEIGEDGCQDVELGCGDQPDPGGCQAAGCFWHGDACHDDPAPAPCDQPDPGACEAAGCVWSDAGCMIACGDLPEPACDVRGDCRWELDHCAVAPHMLPCAEFGPEECLDHESCTWDGNSCVDRPDGACGDLDEAACVVRPDCEAQYADGPGGGEDPPEGGGGGEPPGGGPVPPEQGFVGCIDREFECADVPVDACEPTPGCRLEPVPCQCDCPPGDEDCACDACEPGVICVPEDPAGCRDLDIRQCEQNPECELVERDICGGEGGGRDGDEFVPEPGEPGVPCGVEVSCEPRAPEPGACADIQQFGLCVDTPGCQWIPDADCGGEEPVPPPDCDPNDEACAQPIAPPGDCGRCGPIVGNECWDLAEQVCRGRDDCRWVEDGQGGGGAPPPPVPVPCDCPEGDPDCVCVDPAPVPPPPGGGFCEPDRPQGCFDLDEPACRLDDGCAWEGGGGICECFIDEETGEEICRCEDGPGFCRDIVPPNACENFDQRACVDRDGCIWLELPVEPCACPPGEDCVCPDPAPGFCVPDEMPPPDGCFDLAPEQCEGEPGCRLEEIFPPCRECGPDDPDCEMICEPIVVCVQDDVPPGPCQAQDERACQADGACEWVPGEGGGGGCDCWIDERGQEICVCEGGMGGFCRPRQVQPGECMGLDEAACMANDLCTVLRCEQACLPDDDRCLAECQQVDGLCVDRALICPEAPLEVCDALDGCQIVDPCPPPMDPNEPQCDAEPFCAAAP